MSDLVLELNSVSKTYNLGKANEVPVLQDLCLSLGRGEVVALVAPSGAGKSTLLHVAGLLDTCDSGAVGVNGADLSQASDGERTAARRSEIGFVYQFHHLLPEFSAVENIVLPQLANGMRKSAAQTRAESLLQRLGLGARMNHRPAELSGGEQQRVAFCRALANEPALLLADEPTGNLDPTTAETLFALLLEVARETGLSALIATHNLDLAARMDRMLYLEGGQIKEVSHA
jgi:lipoprotein-releasing system ATP-binding protein